MVTHNAEWDDVDDGYRKSDTGVYVSPAIVHGTSLQSGGIDQEDANAYSVEVRTRLETVSETWDPVAQFKSPRTAWEFANILTHYFSASPDPSIAKSDLLTGGPDPSYDSETLPDIVEDMTARDAFRTLLDPHVPPKGMSDILEDS